ncbi:hypothetical protein EJ08DRAFT_656981 [Tothia fuscella]|uniref:Uncharacterized protein n=1 Tax=Tothia fuscella TaxID=1048955 RepID=A0A9P4P144_9PEZI|nr:hypothetical protein EJ08DRAFT_656981 [Tothia fuscella]
MADSPLLDVLPPELRLKVYGYASQRPDGPYLILKEYLEKRDPDIPALPAQTAAPVNHDATSSGQDEQEGQEEDLAESDDDEAMVDQTEDDAVPPHAAVDSVNTVTDEAAMADSIDEIMDQEHGMQGDDEDNGEHEDEAQDEDEEEDDEEQADEAEEEETQDEDNEDNNTPTQTTVRSYGRNTKYRHMLPTIQLSHCPPPIELLQICPQIRDEAVEALLSACLLKIDVTKSFQHHSFFLETLQQFLDHPFSPIEQIRKMELTFVWDSEWLSAKSTPNGDGLPADLQETWAFGYYLGERIEKTIELLRASPELRSITIQWHDSERTPQSEAFMTEKVMPFLSLTDKQWTDNNGITKQVDVTLSDHFADAGTTHARGSDMQNRRNEFDQLLASQMMFR